MRKPTGEDTARAGAVPAETPHSVEAALSSLARVFTKGGTPNRFCQLFVRVSESNRHQVPWVW